MIIFIALFSICILSYYLIFTVYYDDGVLGRISLAILSFSSFLGFCQALEGHKFDPVSQAIFVGIALFQMRHIYRILRAQMRIRAEKLFEQ